MHFKRTLASFSLENKVSVVTGGARGLGLVMGQALVASGSDLAIVDLNSTYYVPPFSFLLAEVELQFNSGTII
jgi:NAD(P)-dependent dehydrogenase (short-subunit alcohol dehydrogenase family)